MNAKNDKYSEMTEWQLSTIDDYCKKDLKKLKAVCYSVWGRKGLPFCYYDDLYDDAMNVLLESVLTFNENGNASFKTYLTGNIHRSFGQWYRDTHLRSKRNNLELDKDGKIKKDEHGNPIIIHNISFDAPIGGDEEEITLKSIVPDKRTIESQIFDDGTECYSKKMTLYLSRLSQLQREILNLMSIGFKQEDIISELHISKEQYDDSYNAIHSYRNTSILM